ncbi:MAG: efflux transporter outer membrane subunit [Burkholderiaceae bacterium]|nr:efflux transporter outer membrane subunit [Burkholderiaceae bacterium]
MALPSAKPLSKTLLTTLLVASPLWLLGCAVVPPAAQVSAPAASQWYSPLPVSADSATGTAATVTRLPHQGSLTALNQWWQSLGDPLLVELISSAQAVSPTLTAASSRLQQARSAGVAAGAALLPNVSAAAHASRGVPQLSIPAIPLATSSQVGLQAGWELDLWGGGNRAASDAALARLAGSQALWHEARVSVAAEVANSYLNLRSCEQLLAVAREDATSRGETSRLTGLTAEAGFTAPANAALARASAAQGQSNLSLQRTQCDVQVKALVALTAMEEPILRQKMAVTGVIIGNIAIKSGVNSAAMPLLPAVPSVPAELLTQRPDVFAAEREVTAASGDVGSAQAARYPRLSLSGSVAAASLKTGGISINGTTWAIGPLALTLPLFDGGQRAAAVDVANARYDDAVATYRAKVRNAVREVEEALLNLQSTAERSEDAKIATEGYSAAFNAAEARYRSGLGGLSELEDTRRTALAAKTALLNLQRERSAAWIALYRAVGGGWERTNAAANHLAAAK